MEHLLRRLVFKSDDGEYRWQDVVSAAKSWGDWACLARQVREDFARLRAMEAMGVAPTPEDVDAVADEFRYECGLLTVEETEDWLEQRDLTEEAWMEFIRRSATR